MKKCERCGKELIQDGDIKKCDFCIRDDSINRFYVSRFGNNIRQHSNSATKIGKVNDLISNIEKTRLFLYLEIDSYLYIIESFFKGYSFWDDGGSLGFYVFKSLVSTITIEIMKFFDKSIDEDRSSIHSFYLNKDKIMTIKEDIFNIDEGYNVNEILDYIENYINENIELIRTFKIFRNKKFAHTEKTNLEDYKNAFNLVNLKRVIIMLKTIYNMLLFLVSPIGFGEIAEPIDLKIFLNNMEKISNYYKETKGMKNEKQI